MKGFLNEFKKFIMRGNVIDLAVGVIIGGAFQAIVNSLVNDVVSPVISLATKGINFADKFIVLIHHSRYQLPYYGNSYFPSCKGYQ